MLYPSSPVKSLILEYIAENSFSSAKQIVAAVQNYAGKQYSFQGIYKQLKNLITEGILTSHNHHYTFSLEYLSKVSKYSADLIGNVSKLHSLHNIVQNLENRPKMEFHIQSLHQNLNFCRELLLSLMYHSKQPQTCYRYMYYI